MKNRALIQLFVVASTSVMLLSACTNQLVLNPDFPKSGPVWITKTEPEPEPIPAPEPEPEPIPEPVMSLGEQNSLAIKNLGNKGFETNETNQGVVVFLPPNIYFDGSKSSIGLTARAKIAEIANEVNKDYLVERGIEVSGHTDSNGPELNNLGLSKLRAQAAAEELISSQVKKTRLTVEWFGETRPRKKEKDASGNVIRANQKLNRRVEFIILNPK